MSNTSSTHILDEIIATKFNELQSERFEEKRRFYHALKKEGLSVIAEVKRASPSAGELGMKRSAVEQALTYENAGANAISVLTDTPYFKGTLQDLVDVHQAVATTPLLQKDFIIDKRQIIEAALAGASAILLIVAALPKQLQSLYQFARDCQLDVLVEAHTKEEVHQARDIGADIIGINNRDLKTFKTDIQHSLDLINEIPNTAIAVSESGIHHPEQAKTLYEAGFNAVLIGEALVKSEDTQQLLRDFQGQK